MSISDNSQLSSDDDAFKLTSMTPKFDESQHGRYVKRLRNALYEQNCKSVALSGSYGSGKSSILKQFIKEAKEDGHSVAKVNLATFNADACSQGECADSSITSLLEREILGQLLYQGDSAKAPKSSFNQIHNASLMCKVKSAMPVSLIILIALLAALVFHFSRTVTFASCLALITDAGSERLRLLMALVIVVLVAAYSAISLICGYFLWVFDRARIRSISASGITLSIAADEGCTSYFNKYRDELIYLFEVNGFDTVVFEDIDRFDDLAIFEELRKLNDLLNMAPGIVGKDGNKVVSFIYAVKDSIFALNGEPDEDSREVLGSRRVKFFDMIISVVPFISKFNANEMAVKLFELELEEAQSTKEGQHFSDLLLLVAPYIADMRLMISIRNDYLVMVQEMGSPSFGHPSSLGLTCTGILAIAIYKNLYPLEYEDLRIGKGMLNELYDIHQKGINRLLPQLSAANKLAHRCKEHGVLLDDVAETLGNVLKEAFDKRVSSIECITIESDIYHTRREYSDNIFQTRFWEVFLSLNSDDCLYIGQRHGTGGQGVKLTKREFLDLFNVEIPDTGMRDLLSDGFTDTSFANLDSKTEQLRTVDFYTKQDLLCPINTNGGEERLESFAKIVKQTIGDELVCELILEGYIRKDFDLYISKYPAEAKPRAVNFVYHCYQRGVQDLDCFLDSDDCSAVLNIIPTVHLDRPCCFNRYLLSHILGGGGAPSTTVDRDAVITIVNGIVANYTSSGKQLIERLLELYPDNKGLVHKFISALLNQTERAFDILIDSSESVCMTQPQYELVSYAFANMNLNTLYECELSSSWMSTNIETMSIADVISDEARANTVANYLSRCSITIHKLSALGTELGSSVAELGNYDVTRANLLLACKTPKLPTLDMLEEAYPSVYKRVVSSEDALSSYLTALNPGEFSITGFSSFIFISLCRAVASWNDSANIDELASSIIAKIKPEAEEVNLSELDPNSPIENTNAMGIALVRELILNKKVAGTLSNANFILKLETVDELSGDLYLFDRFIKDFSIYEMRGDQTLEASDVLNLANGLMYRAHPASTNLLNALTRLRVMNNSIFPLTVNDETIGKMHCTEFTLVDLIERNFIGPANVVYEYLDGSKWNSRRKILKKLLQDNPSKDRSVLPRLFSCDLPRIVSAAKSWGSWLAKDIASCPHYYIDQSCDDDSEKAKVIAEIEGKAKKYDLF